MAGAEVSATGPETVTRVGHVSGVKTDLAITQYSDKTLLHLTQLGKFGSWLQVSCSQSEHSIDNFQPMTGGETNREEGRLC